MASFKQVLSPLGNVMLGLFLGGLVGLLMFLGVDRAAVLNIVGGIGALLVFVGAARFVFGKGK